MTSSTLSGALRILPVGMYAGRSHVVLQRAFRVYTRSWLVILTGFFEPLFYLFALGTGLKHLVGPVVGPGGHPISYMAFIAPALLASSAMNGAIYDSTNNVFWKLQYAKLYDSMLATSLGPLDVAIGEITWALIRGGLYSAGFLTIMLITGLTASAWAALLLPSRSCRCSCSAARSTACRSTHGGCRSWSNACRSTMASRCCAISMPACSAGVCWVTPRTSSRWPPSDWSSPRDGSTNFCCADHQRDERSREEPIASAD
jgi:hypothetical protein